MQTVPQGCLIKGESYRLKTKRTAGVLNAPVKEKARLLRGSHSDGGSLHARDRTPYRAENGTSIRAADKRLNQDRSLGIDEICKTLGISRSTFYRYLAVADGVRKY